MDLKLFRIKKKQIGNMNTISKQPYAEISPQKKQILLNDSFARTIFDSLSANTAILDKNGVILATNRSWQKFAEGNNMKADFDSAGYNYLEICDRASGDDAQISQKAAEGIRSVINGDMNEFIFDYPCHSPTQKHWFNMRVVRFSDPQSVKVIVSHEEITALKLVEESLRENEKLLRDQKKELEESNIALKVILKQRELDRVDLEQRVLDNIKELVFPYMEKLKISNLNKNQAVIVDLIENHLKDIISPFLERLSSLSKILTPQELQVATMIKDGKSSKEIADVFNVSISTVNFHRKNLRMKFGLNNKKANLRSYLSSLT